MLRCYSCKRKNNRLTMAVFSNIADISALNAYIIYKEIDPNWMTKQKHTKRKCFLRELAISLASPYMEKRKKLPRKELSAVLLSILSIENTAGGKDNEAGPFKTS